MPTTSHGLKLVGDWKKAKEVITAAPDDLEQALESAVLGLGEKYAGLIRKKMGSNVAPPNSPFTVMAKRSSKTLINKGDLRNSVTAIRVGRFQVFVGVPRTAKTKVASPIGESARLANILENGAIIVMQMTDKQRRYLHATIGKKASKTSTKEGNTGVLVIHIPARPFIRPVFDEHLPKAPAEMERLVIRNLKKLAGP